MCSQWYDQRRKGAIISNNFQLHPPRNIDSNVFTNNCGDLQYPLLLSAERGESGFVILIYDAQALRTGACTPATGGSAA